MICAAVSGLMARSTRPAITRFSQTNSGIFPSVMPGQRMHRIVVRMLIAVPMLPNAGDQERQRPVIGAVSARECLRGQRRVGEPSHVGRVARAIEAVAAEKLK